MFILDKPWQAVVKPASAEHDLGRLHSGLSSSPFSQDGERSILWGGKKKEAIFCSFLKNRRLIVEFVQTRAMPEFDICFLGS